MMVEFKNEDVCIYLNFRQDICLEKLKNIKIDKTNTGVNSIDVRAQLLAYKTCHMLIFI